jgi:hypothetical protein
MATARLTKSIAFSLGILALSPASSPGFSRLALNQRQVRHSMRNLIQLACRATMLKEAADALPSGRDRDLLLLQLHDFEEQLRTATIIQRPAIRANIDVDAAA